MLRVDPHLHSHLMRESISENKVRCNHTAFVKQVYKKGGCTKTEVVVILHVIIFRVFNLFFIFDSTPESV